MSKNNIHIVLVLDRSGSMESVVPVTISGVNEMIDTLKNVQKETKTKLNLSASLIGFESEGGYSYGRGQGSSAGFELMPGFEDVSVKNLKHVTDKEIYGGGGTEMNKAIRFGIDQFKSKENVLFAIFTDGQTSDRNLFEEVSGLIEDKQEKGWTFAFIGANQDASQIAKQLKIPVKNAMEYQSDAAGTRGAFFRLSRGVRKYLEQKAENFDADLTDNFFNDPELQLTKMAVNGLGCTINMPESIRSEDDTDNALPPYSPIPAYVVDEYPGCPDSWENGSTKASSYFVGVKEGRGMWLDFNEAAKGDHDVAVVVSVQGVNPITGQKQIGKKLNLERYDTKCPVHDKEFHQDRFCADCGFKWPTQNYLSTTGTPHGQFWLDGFRTPEGKVRQYVITEDMARSVAKAIAGEDRVFAIGIAFYRSKVAKPKPVMYDYGRGGTVTCSFNAAPMLSVAPASASWGGAKLTKRSSRASGQNVTASVNQVSTSKKLSLRSEPAGNSFLRDATKSAVDTSSISMDSDDGLESLTLGESLAPKSYEIGAGAKIDQQVHVDPNSLDYWEEEPYGMIFVNYTDEDTLKKILAAGKRKETKEGFLAAVAVGNK